MLPWQQSAIYSYEGKWNPRCVANLQCECQELKPKVETNTSFLIRHPFSGVDTVKTVGSHLNLDVEKSAVTPFNSATALCIASQIVPLNVDENGGMLWWVL